MALRERWEDFQRAFARRDETAYRVALGDFRDHLRRWTAAEEAALLPALARAPFAGRDPQRELRLEFVQVRELTRFLGEQIESRSPVADVLGLTENLDRRLTAHERELLGVYYPAASAVLTDAEWELLAAAAPAD